MKDESKGFLEKAEHALRAAEILLREEDAECAAGRGGRWWRPGVAPPSLPA